MGTRVWINNDTDDHLRLFECDCIRHPEEFIDRDCDCKSPSIGMGGNGQGIIWFDSRTFEFGARSTKLFDVLCDMGINEYQDEHGSPYGKIDPVEMYCFIDDAYFLKTDGHRALKAMCEEAARMNELIIWG